MPRRGGNIVRHAGKLCRIPFQPVSALITEERTYSGLRVSGGLSLFAVLANFRRLLLPHRQLTNSRSAYANLSLAEMMLWKFLMISY
jgi:hypothetical protein